MVRRVFMRELVRSLALSCLALSTLVDPASAQADSDCLMCHGDESMGAPLIDQTRFSQSAHVDLGCLECHTGADEIPHPGSMQAETCATCHDDVVETYLSSDHGRALSRNKTLAETCGGCHGDIHVLQPARMETSAVHRSHIASTCGVCHGNPEFMGTVALSEMHPVDTYSLTVHGTASQSGDGAAAVCTDCHGYHTLQGASSPQSKVYPANIPKTCGACHSEIEAAYEASIHGKAATAGIKESPVCTNCHGEHTIRAVKDPASSVHVGAVTKTCAQCHASERISTKFGLPSDRLGTFYDSYHGLAGRLGDYEAANCASCHGWHDVLPSSDPKSWVYPANLARTCGRCHTGTQVRTYQGRVHGGTPLTENAWIAFVKIFYVVLIPTVVGGMFVHNFVDWLRKLRHPSPPLHAHELEVLRLDHNERVQHGLLTATFCTLAYSGFVLKFPEAWWAAPFRVLGGEMLRRNVHRWTALVFTLLCFFHLVYLAFSRRGRQLIGKDLKPGPQDLLHPVQLFLYNVGLRGRKPTLGYPSYIERAEYWALVWGSAVMVITGGMLVFHDLVLGWLPLWASELATMIHFYEAILACLAILVWHGYWVILDPDVYPMNWAWLSGRLKPTKENA